MSPFGFLQACGTILQDENDNLLNGDISQDTWHFINELLKRLDEEDTVKPSVVQDLFRVSDAVKVSGHCCEST